MRLRDYQIAARDAVIAASGSVILQLPTGAGKTVTAIDVIRQRMQYGPAWFVCHRREIIRQACRALNNAWLPFAVVASDREVVPWAPIQVVSIDTIRNRPDILPDPATIIWDECQHVPARTWSALFDRHVNALHVGLTATPERLDGKGLASWFGEIVNGPSIGELISAGHLAKYRIFAPTEPDLTSAKMRMGDYVQGDLEKIMNQAVVIGSAVEHYQRIIPGKRALAFCVSIDASKALVQQFNDAGVVAKHIDGDTDDAERDAAIDDLETGRIQIVSNVNVFTEGVDVPSIDGVILLRPTKSLALYLQMIGRGLRPCDGKNIATILDHSGMVYEHGFPDAEYEWSLAGGARKARLAKARVGGEVIRRCPECACAHSIAPSCPECGYVYPTGRKIGECDGKLYEIRGAAAPAGCETVAAYARRIEVKPCTVKKWIEWGMPSFKGHVRSAEADIWIKETGRAARASKYRAPNNCDAISPPRFAKIIGVSRGTVERLVMEGMPHAENGWPIKNDAMEWVKKNYTSRVSRPYDVENPEEYMAPVDFEDRHRLNRGHVWVIKQHLKTASNGWVHIPTGDVWVRENLTQLSDELMVSKRQFADEHGVGVHIVDRWIKKGLPRHQNKRAKKIIYLDRARKWVKEYGNSDIPPKDDDEYVTCVKFASLLGVHFSIFKNCNWKDMPRGPHGTIPKRRALQWIESQNMARLPPMDVENPAEYERPGVFASRLNASDSCPSVWRRRGLPCASNGWVHIVNGLRWVSENTKIEIPASAWGDIEGATVDRARGSAPYNQEQCWVP